MEAQKRVSELLDLLVEKEKAAAEVSAINMAISTKIQAAADAFSDEEIGPKGIDVKGIVFKPKEQQQFALGDTEEGLKWDDSSRWFKFLKQNGDGGLIKTKESVPWNTRDKYLKGLLADGHDLPDFIRYGVHQTIDWNKSAVKRMAV